MPLLFGAFWAFVGVLAPACGAGSPPVHSYAGTVIEPPKVVADFTLTDQNNTPYTLSQNVEDMALIYFGYAFCPDVCPMSLADMLNVKRGLPGNVGPIEYLMISVDPERDTPAALANRLGVFDQSFVGVTGERAELEKVWEDFGVVATREEVVGSAAGYLVAHTANLYLVDRDLRLRLVFPFGTAPDDMIEDIVEVFNRRRSS
jgi:protein SCO1/2